MAKVCGELKVIANEHNKHLNHTDSSINFIIIQIVVF
jgi:hypothetical protein